MVKRGHGEGEGDEGSFRMFHTSRAEDFDKYIMNCFFSRKKSILPTMDAREIPGTGKNLEGVRM